MTSMITDPQKRFIVTLLNEREVDDAHRKLIVDRCNDGNVTRSRASEWIERLLAKPFAKRDPNPRDEPWSPINIANTGCEPLFCMLPRGGDGTVVVPRGSYAIDTRNGTNELMFISVWFSKDGERWSVKRYESDTLVKLPRSQQYDILDRISRDPVGAAERYGLEIGKCGICHRTLTNDVSRARGIGPICAERWGW